MKKLLALLLALVMVCTLMACGKEQNTNASGDAAAQQTQGSTKNNTDNTVGGPVTDTSTGQVIDGSETSSTGGSVKNTDGTTADTDSGEDIDLGVKESGEDIIVSAENDTPSGKATCVMTYKYSKGALQTVTAAYVMADAAAAKELAKELESNTDVNPDSIAIQDKSVTCTLSDATITELKGISRSDMLDALKYAQEAM